MQRHYSSVFTHILAKQWLEHTGHTDGQWRSDLCCGLRSFYGHFFSALKLPILESNQAEHLLFFVMAQTT